MPSKSKIDTGCNKRKCKTAKFGLSHNRKIGIGLLQYSVLHFRTIEYRTFAQSQNRNRTFAVQFGARQKRKSPNLGKNEPVFPMELLHTNFRWVPVEIQIFSPRLPVEFSSECDSKKVGKNFCIPRP